MKQYNTLKDFIFIQKFGEKLTIKDAKLFIQEQCNKNAIVPICLCFLYGVYTQDCDYKNYKDDILLEKTEFNENNKMFFMINKNRRCTCFKLNSIINKNFNLEIIEWKKNGNGCTLKNYSYIQNFKKLSTIKDIKLFIQKNIYNDLSIPLCLCFLSIYKFVKIENNKNIYEKCDNYNDDTKLNDTIFYENNKLCVGFNEERKCICQQFEIQKENLIQKKEIETMKGELSNTLNNFISQMNEIENNRSKRIWKIESQLNNVVYSMKQEKENRIEEDKRKKYGEKSFNNNRGNIIKRFYENQSNKINNLINKIENKMKENIYLEDFNKDLLIRLSELGNFELNIENLLKSQLNLLNNNISSTISHFNILIIGNTGVGKSTLINKILKEKVAKTSFGNIGTTSIKSYESKKCIGIKIWDTRGFEYSEKYNIEIAFKDMKKLILDLIQKNDPIHCIWYCIGSASDRCSDQEIANIINCKELYKIQKLPIILVFTKSTVQIKADRLMNYVNDRLLAITDINYRKNIQFLKILAEDDEDDENIIQSFGIYNLMKETCECAEKGIQSSIIELLIKEGINIIKKKFNNIIQEIYNDYNKEQFQEKEIYININNNIYENSQAIKIGHIKFTAKVFKNLIIKYVNKMAFSLISLKNINPDMNKVIDFSKIINNKIDTLNGLFNEIFGKNIDCLTGPLIEEYIKEAKNLDENNGLNKYLTSVYNYNELKIRAKEDIETYIKPLIESKIYEKMIIELIGKYSNELSNKFLEIYNHLLISNDSIKKLFENKGKRSMEIICNNIKSIILNKFTKDDYQKKKKKKNEPIIHINDDNNNLENEIGTEYGFAQYKNESIQNKEDENNVEGQSQYKEGDKKEGTNEEVNKQFLFFFSRSGGA